MDRLNFGLHYSCQSTDGKWNELYNEVLNQAQLAEQVGFESLFVAEHHFMEDGWMPAPTIMAAALAGVTDEITVGTNILVLPLHHPVEIAEHVGVLDNLTNGNFRLGVAIGWREEEFEAFGVDRSERVGRTVEGIELIRQLLTETEVTYNGDHFAVSDLTVTPRPIQNPVPIWYGAVAPPAIRRAARIADAWMTTKNEDWESLTKKNELYHDALEEHGRSRAEVYRPLQREAYIAEDDETAWEEVQDALLYHYKVTYEDSELSDIQTIEDVKEYGSERFIIGGPDTAIEKIRALNDSFDIDEIVFRMQFPRLAPEQTTKSIRIFGEEVLPHFQ